MDRAPLPPHERPWRHPSELGPTAQHEPTSGSARAIIVTTATLSLLLIGLLAVSMTPDRGDAPVAVASTTSHSRAAALEQPAIPLVTPIGDDGWAVTTSDAAGDNAGAMAARLPSGDVVSVDVVRHDDESGLTLVSLPTATDGYQLAAQPPAPGDTVTVAGEPPQIATMTALADLDVEEATPVLDDAGNLVGLCTIDHGTVVVRTVSTMPHDATETTATTRPAVTEPTTPTEATPPATTPVSEPPSSTDVPVTSIPATDLAAPSTALPDRASPTSGA